MSTDEGKTDWGTLSLTVHCDPACTGQYREGLPGAQEVPNSSGAMPRDNATPSRVAAGVS